MLFLLKHNTSGKYRYALEDTSVLGYNHTVCPQCNRRISTLQYKDAAPHLILEGGKALPDLLSFCGAGKQLFLPSEKALQLFKEAGITGWSELEAVTIEEIGKNRNVVPVPTYYNLCIFGRIEFDFAAMQLKKKSVCPVCGQFTLSRTRLPSPILDATSWDHSDLCRIESIPGYTVCTDKVKALVTQHDLTGFSFEAVD